jgi:hypothetical protein
MQVLHALLLVFFREYLRFMQLKCLSLRIKGLNPIWNCEDIMNHTEARVGATFFIWVAFTVVSVAAIVNSSEIGGLIFLIMILLTGGAVTATQSVWKSVDTDKQGESEKSKRQGKLDRVMARLSEQDIEELRARLLEDSDGEAVSLDELLHRRDRM